MGGKRGERASSPSATRPMSRQRRVCATVCSADPQQLQLAPAPKQTKPSAHECVQVYQALAQLFPEKAATPKPNHGPRRSVLDSLVGTMLSQNTTDTTSARAFAQLKAAFPEWEQVRTAEPADVEKQIKVCGLAATRAERIQAILQTLHAEQGVCSLEHLRDLPDAEVKRQLSRFKGVGAKTISCVLMFCLRRAEFPVDTHVWKIAIALGWVSSSASRDQTYEHLNAVIPDDIKYPLHVMLVQYGKQEKNNIKLLRAHCRAMTAIEVD